ncbi:MAG: hypothetical protein ABI323_10530, partial [Solirubrobacteraceae bacterium]
AFRAERRRSEAPVLLVGMPGEQHVLGLQMAASILLHAGYGVVMLGGGAAVPASLRAIAGVAVCGHVGDAVELTDSLMHRSQLN